MKAKRKPRVIWVGEHQGMLWYFGFTKKELKAKLCCRPVKFVEEVKP